MLSGIDDLRHSEFVHIKEIASHPTGMVGHSVRLVGNLISYDVNLDLAVIRLDGDEALIDTSLLNVFKYSMNKLYMFFGEVDDYHVCINNLKVFYIVYKRSIILR